MKIKIITFAVLFSLLVPVLPVHAQGETPYVIDSTKPMDADLRSYLDAWLAADPPSDVPYYIVTNVSNRSTHWIVSLVGVDLASPDDEWSLEENNTTWMGTVTVGGDGTVSPFSHNIQTTRVNGRASIRFAAGGGSYVAFPFAAGTSALYGSLGVHGSGEYGTNGMLFVDLVGGDNMGSSSMPPNVYASDAGEIDYVCDDGVNVAVRTYNAETGDYFLYAHLLDNASLDYEVEFAQGELIGDLKYGTFEGGSPSCGAASQSESHYHVHWGFVPSGGKYQVGSCILSVSTQAWTCGDEVIKTGGYLSGGGGDVGTDDSGAALSDPTFFDYILAGIVGLVSRSIVDLLPAHEPFAYTYAIYNVVQLLFKLVFVFIQSNVSLRWVFIVILYAFSLKILVGAISIIPLVFRFFKWIVPVA